MMGVSKDGPIYWFREYGYEYGEEREGEERVAEIDLRDKATEGKKMGGEKKWVKWEKGKGKGKEDGDEEA
jgi:hypothetical protein